MSDPDDDLDAELGTPLTALPDAEPRPGVQVHLFPRSYPVVDGEGLIREWPPRVPDVHGPVVSIDSPAPHEDPLPFWAGPLALALGSFLLILILAWLM
jgi:hypothetical protein